VIQMEENMDQQTIKNKVREGYARVATHGGSCCGPAASCCGTGESVQRISELVGYSREEMTQVPEGANLGLGCGNPVALASLREGETVLDLGSGAGFDCFLAAGAVGETGRVIGVDMTPEMVQKARENAQKGGYQNVEFRLGEIENLPVADNLADVIISNCVVNLAPDKRRVFREAFRALKPGGRLMVSDIVLREELPDFLRNSISAYVSCVAGAMKKEDYLEAIEAAGFRDVRIMGEASFPVDVLANDPTVKGLMQESGIPPQRLSEIGSSVLSVKVQAIKPQGGN
jgi:arsenite methyltransferase